MYIYSLLHFRAPVFVWVERAYPYPYHSHASHQAESTGKQKL